VNEKAEAKWNKDTANIEMREREREKGNRKEKRKKKS